MKQPPANPFPYGKVVVPTPGTPVKLTATIEPTYPDANDLSCSSLAITALDTNTGNVYIGSATMNKSTRDGVMFVMTAGSIQPINAAAGLNAIRPERYYVDADIAGEGVFSSGLIA